MGHAYNRGEPWYVPDVSKYGGFAQALRLCGLTSTEVSDQSLSDRTSFAAFPLLAPTEAGERQVLAILAVDSAQVNAFPDDLLSLIQVEANAVLRALTPKETKSAPQLAPRSLAAVGGDADPRHRP